MIPVHIYDDSALVALFDADYVAMDVSRAGDDGRAQVVWPACAIASANSHLRETAGSWAPLLMGRVVCSALTEGTAIDVGGLAKDLGTDDLATGHVVYEARATSGVVVTAEPGRYRSSTLPLLVL